MNDSIRSERPSMLSQGEIFTSKCITNMNTSSPLKRILNNLTIQIIFEYFMDIYNKLFPYGNIGLSISSKMISNDKYIFNVSFGGFNRKKIHMN